MPERVWITGLGLDSSLGHGVATNWQKVALGLPAPASSTRLDGFTHAVGLAETATREALTDAGLWDGTNLVNVSAEQVGCTVSASKPLFTSEPLPPLWGKVGMGGEPPTSVLPHEGGGGQIMSPDAINSSLCETFKFRGETRNVIAACATGAYSIALASAWIEEGLCDVVVAGSVEPYPHPLIEAGFHRMGVVTGETVMRPFDRQRSGFVFGEGAGIIVLESETHARRRRANRYARLSGWGLGADGHSSVAFNSNGQRIANVIRHTLDRAGIAASGVRHVNAHGTATRLNDWIETQALIKAFGRGADQMMISATKGSTGHLLGAAGSVEFIFTVLSLLHQFVPPTSNLDDIDPGCPLDYTPRIGRTAAFDHALSLSFGFGGSIGALLVSKP